MHLQCKGVNTSLMFEKGQNRTLTAGDYCVERDTLRAQQTIHNSFTFISTVKTASEGLWHFKQSSHILHPQLCMCLPACVRADKSYFFFFFYSVLESLGGWEEETGDQSFVGVFIETRLSQSFFPSSLLLSLHTVAHLWSYFLSHKHTKAFDLEQKVSYKSGRSSCIISTAAGPCWCEC